MLQRLQGRGITCYVCAELNQAYASAEIGVGGPRLPFYPEVRISIPRRVWEAAQGSSPADVVHIGPVFLGPRAHCFAQQLDVPSSLTHHTNTPRYYQHYYRGAGFLGDVVLSARCIIKLTLICSSSTMLAGYVPMASSAWWWQRWHQYATLPAWYVMKRCAAAVDGHPEIFGTQRRWHRAGSAGTDPSVLPTPRRSLGDDDDGPVTPHLQTDAFAARQPCSPATTARTMRWLRRTVQPMPSCSPSTTETFWAGGAGSHGVRSAGYRRPRGQRARHRWPQRFLFFDLMHHNKLVLWSARLQLSIQPTAGPWRTMHSTTHSRDWRMTMDQLIHYCHLAISVAPAPRTAPPRCLTPLDL